MLKELSPELLQHAADKSREMRRYKQADNLETGAIDTVNNELNPGGQDKNIRYGVNNVAWVTPDKWSCVLCSNGRYRTSHLYGRGLTTSGTLSGTEIVPKEMKTDPAQARKIVNWWKRFGQADLPQFTDWHNLVNYDTIKENINKINESDLRIMIKECVRRVMEENCRRIHSN